LLKFGDEAKAKIQGKKAKKQKFRGKTSFASIIVWCGSLL
jgi:hypothetical protein